MKTAFDLSKIDHAEVYDLCKTTGALDFDVAHGLARCVANNTEITASRYAELALAVAAKEENGVDLYDGSWKLNWFELDRSILRRAGIKLSQWKEHKYEDLVALTLQEDFPLVPSTKELFGFMFFSRGIERRPYTTCRADGSISWYKFSGGRVYCAYATKREELKSPESLK